MREKWVMIEKRKKSSQTVVHKRQKRADGIRLNLSLDTKIEFIIEIKYAKAFGNMMGELRTMY